MRRSTVLSLPHRLAFPAFANQNYLRLGQFRTVHLVRVSADAQLGNGQRRDLPSAATAHREQPAESSAPVARALVTVA